MSGDLSPEWTRDKVAARERFCLAAVAFRDAFPCMSRRCRAANVLAVAFNVVECTVPRTRPPQESPPKASPDSHALVALFHATGGANWTRKGNWCTSAELMTWDGVKVNEQGRVIELDLSDNNLRGIR